tara:strand:+ start:551 stop:1015 length:465 start_codon:yes stop_codon:yes gene_type:complete
LLVAVRVTVSAVQYVAPLSVDFDTLMMKLEPVGAVSNVIYQADSVVALPIAHSNNIFPTVIVPAMSTSLRNQPHPQAAGVCQDAEVQLIAVAICQTVGVPVIVIPHTFVLSAAVQVTSSFVSISVCCAVLTGLSASEVLFTFHNQTVVAACVQV